MMFNNISVYPIIEGHIFKFLISHIIVDICNNSENICLLLILVTILRFASKMPNDY